MKSTIKLFGIIALVAIIGFSMASCDDGNDDNGDGSLNGTWVNAEEGLRLVLNNGNFTMSLDNVESTRGTYTTSGSNITINVTHISGVMFEEMGLSATQWYTEAQLRTAMIEFMVRMGLSQADAEAMFDEEAEEGSMFGSSTGTYTLSGNTLTITQDGETSTFTRQ